MDKHRVKKSSGLKGSVLYTVTLVMMVMLILMMSAIALAGTANKRAFGEYHDDQTTYTGRSIVESVVKTFSETGANAALGDYIFEQLRDNSDEIVVINVNDGTPLPDGYGTVEKLEFQNVGEDSETGFYITGSGFNIVKVTATVRMGNEVTTYSEYVSGMDFDDPPPSGGAGFLAAGGFYLNGSTGSGFHGPSYAQIFPKELSPLSWPDAYEKPITVFRNPVKISGGGLYGSTVAFTTSNAQVSFSRNVNGSNGLTVMGNLILKNDMSFLSDYTPDSSGSITNIPYIYCDGTFYTSNKSYIGVPLSGITDDRLTNPINLYVGRIILAPNNGDLYSSIYCYNFDKTYATADPKPLRTTKLPDTIPLVSLPDTLTDADIVTINGNLDATSPTSIIGSSSGTQLLDWAASTIGDGSTNTGSIYTKGNLKLGVTTGGCTKVIINGDVCVDQILDMTDTSTHSVISGNIYVNGQLMVASADQLMDILKHHSGTKIVCRSITDASGNDLSGTTWVKDGTTYDVTISPVAFTWPTGMEKEDILGKTDASYKIIATQKDAFKKFYDVDAGKYKRSINNSSLEVSDDSKIYYYASNEVKMRTVSSAAEENKGKVVDISESCTMVGKFDGCTFNITPPNDGDKIWINLYDVEFINECKVIVDDSKGREVYFYIPQGENYSPSKSPSESAYFDAISFVDGISDARDEKTMSNSFKMSSVAILTKNYYETYFEKSDSLKKQLDLHTYYPAYDVFEESSGTQIKVGDKDKENGEGQNLVPDIYICAADNTGPSNMIEIGSGIGSGDGKCVLTGHIIALNAHFTWKNSSHSHSGNLTYTVDGTSKEDELSAAKKISVIGSIFVNGVKEIQNDFEFFYVDYEGEGEGPTEYGQRFAWNLIDGYVSY